MAIAIMKKRYRSSLPTLILAIILLVLILRRFTQDENSPNVTSLLAIKKEPKIGYYKDINVVKNYLKQVLENIEKHRPDVTLPIGKYPNPPDGGKYQYAYNAELTDNFELEDGNESKLAESHHEFVKSIPKIMPDGVYNGKGVVILTERRELPNVYAGLTFLRKSGTSLPVEVFLIDDDDYDKGFCEELFPQFNAACVKFDDLYDLEDLKNFAYKGYPMKALSILASSFEEVVFYTPDTFPVYNLDTVLESEPYTINGLITWTDFWRWMVHSSFKPIAKRAKGFHFPQLAASNNMVIINKSSHYRTIILATYYNLYGKNIYYDLIAQNGEKMGDKDTYTAAAIALQAPFYQVRKVLEWTGYRVQFEHGGSMDVAGGVIQYNPVEDWLQAKALLVSPAYVHLMFVFVNAHEKFDYEKYVQDGVFINSESHNGASRYIRLLGTAGKFVKYTGFDFELALWQVGNFFFCQSPEYISSLWVSTDIATSCTITKEYADFLKRTTAEIEEVSNKEFAVGVS